MKKKALLLLVGFFLFAFLSCKTVQFDKIETQGESNTETYEEEIRQIEKENEQYEIVEQLKEVDVEKTVVYVEKPVYYPLESPPLPPPSGVEAVSSSLQEAIQKPSEYSKGMMYYDYDENFVYEIYCQPYRITDLSLEPGEQVLEVPFLSEDKVWEMGAGVSRKKGLDVQHFYLKPSMGGLTTSMIIITDRRIYHLLLKSFKDIYMAMVSWNYPNTMPYTVKTDAMDYLNKLRNEKNLIDPKFLSFDYKMSYSIFKKPLWLPQSVYDDGRKTYIRLDERVLHSSAPALFNESNKRINYRADKNLIIIDELIKKVTLKLGNEKVVIEKKKYMPPTEEVEEKSTEAEVNNNET